MYNKKPYYYFQIFKREKMLPVINKIHFDFFKLSALLTMSIGCTLAGIVWGSFYIFLGFYNTAIFPFLFSFVVGVSIILFKFIRKKNILLCSQLFMIFWTPIAVQWSLGGFNQSGAVIIWSFLSPLGAIIFLKKEKSIPIVIIYFIFLIISTWYDYYFYTNTKFIVPNIIKMYFYSMNIFGVSLTTIIAFYYYTFELKKRDLKIKEETKKLEEANFFIEIEKQKSEILLLNILPEKIAEKLKTESHIEPVYFENASIFFTDFVSFTKKSELISPQELVSELDFFFSYFDRIIDRHKLEKLKTIGDSYMGAGGIPKACKNHAIHTCLAALEIQDFMKQSNELKNSKKLSQWEMRFGIHSGPVIAGVIGRKKFAYDVWGDTVNTASRMVASGHPGKINISIHTYELIKRYFECEYRGKIAAKSKGEINMYFLIRIQPEFSEDELGLIPNKIFLNTILE